MEEHRKVKFSLAEPGLSLMDYDTDDLSVGAEKTKERNGLFHTFGNSPFWDSEKGEWRNKIVGIVEELSTGKVYEVNPQMIRFVKQRKKGK